MSTLLDVVLARGLAEISCGQVTATPGSGAVPIRLQIRPDTGYRHAVVAHIAFSVPRPEDMGQPIAVLASNTTTNTTTYQTVASWTVSDGRTGVLHDVAFEGSLDNSLWQLTIGGTLQFTGQTIGSSPDFPFPKNELPPGGVVLIEHRSTNGSITGYGLITGKEFPTHVFTAVLRKPGGIVDHTLNVNRDSVERGLDTWAYVTEQDPLILDVSLANGYGGEQFGACIYKLNTDEQRLATIKEIAQQFGVHDQSMQSLAQMNRAAHLLR